MTQALVQQRPAPIAVVAGNLTRDQIELLKRTVAKGTTDDEFSLFIATANRMGLDPFAKQIYAVKRWDNRERREVMAIQVGVDGHRLAAIRTGELDGEDGPYWCGPDRVWVDVWLDDAPPAAAKFTVYRKGCSRPFTAVARYRSYVQTTKEGGPNSMWSRGADFMLAKCAECLAKRKAFPAELGGVIAPEEAGSEDYAAADFQPLPVNAPKSAPLAVDPNSDFARAARAGEPTPTLGSDPSNPPTYTGAPTTEPTPAGPLTEEEIVDLLADMANAKTQPQLGAVAKVIDGHNKAGRVTADQYAQLLAAHKENQARIRNGAKP